MLKTKFIPRRILFKDFLSDFYKIAKKNNSEVIAKKIV